MADHPQLCSDRFDADDQMLPATRTTRGWLRSACDTLLAAVVILGVMLALGYFLGEELHG